MKEYKQYEGDTVCNTFVGTIKTLKPCYWLLWIHEDAWCVTGVRACMYTGVYQEKKRIDTWCVFGSRWQQTAQGAKKVLTSSSFHLSPHLFLSQLWFVRCNDGGLPVLLIVFSSGRWSCNVYSLESLGRICYLPSQICLLWQATFKKLFPIPSFLPPCK